MNTETQFNDDSKDLPTFMVSGYAGNFTESFFETKEKQKTAVEWLIEQFAEYYEIDELDEEIEQAKELEKEQIIKAHGIKKSYSNGNQIDPKIITGEDYYNQTYNE